MEISNPPITPQIITRSFPGRYDSLAQIGEFIRGIAQKAGLGNFAAYTVEMAVDEACSNIIEHAYGGEDRGEITCTCKVNTQGLTIELDDYGKPFNPEDIADPDVSGDLEDRPSHGLGLFFIRQWMDEVEFEFKENHGNHLVLFKKEPTRIPRRTARKNDRQDIAQAICRARLEAAITPRGTTRPTGHYQITVPVDREVN